MKATVKALLLISSLYLLFAGCTKDGDLNIFSVDDDIKFGQQLDEEIKSKPSEYPILDKAKYPEAYAYIEAMFQDILSSSEIDYRDEFPWKITIINADVKNAFAAPGGYLYFYTGLMKYSESASEFAGVIAHEVAHADKRHSTNVLTKVYGMTMMADIVLGKGSGALSDIAKQMALGGSQLKFTREHEYQADEYSVRYLASIKERKAYHSTAMIAFFDRLVRDGVADGSGNFEFTRTHPYEENRKTNINKIWSDLGSPQGNMFDSEYKAFLSKLP